MSVPTPLQEANALIWKYEKEGEKGKLEQSKKNIENMLGKNAKDNAIKRRGDAFIAGAKLILENTPPIVSKSLTLNNAEKTRKDNALAALEKIKKSWHGQGKHEKESLKGLMQHLIELLGGGALKSEKNKRLMKQLTNAENHSNWGQGIRKKQQELIVLGEGILQVRIDEPITKLTQEQEKQWLAILKKGKEPKWFKKLGSWEQNFFRKKIEEWQNIPAKNRINLGDYLGVPPTTIRGYPGARNAYKSYFYTYKKNRKTGQFELASSAFKIRSGHISPSKVKNRKERLELAKENVKQLILARAQDQINRGQTNLLVDLQTLITPPWDFTEDRDRLEVVRMLRKELGDKYKFTQFLKENGIRTDKPIELTLVSSNHAVNEGRLPANFVNAVQSVVLGSLSIPLAIPSVICTGIGKFFSSIGLSKLGKFFERAGDKLFPDKLYPHRALENYKTMSALEKRAAEIAQGSPTRNQKMAIDALAKIKEISGPFQRISNFLTIATTGINHNAERAALEQIAVSGLRGIRVGSCMSGKDREGGITEHVAAMTAFYGKHGRFPPIPGITGLNKEELLLRKEYEKMVAEQFLAGYEQSIADANAPGATGLKSIKAILGSNVMHAVRSLIIEKYFKDASPHEKKYWENCSIAKLTIEIASLNRVKGYSQNDVYQKIKEDVEKSASTPKESVAKHAADITLLKKAYSATEKLKKTLENKEDKDDKHHPPRLGG